MSVSLGSPLATVTSHQPGSTNDRIVPCRRALACRAWRLRSSPIPLITSSVSLCLRPKWISSAKPPIRAAGKIAASGPSAIQNAAAVIAAMASIPASWARGVFMVSVIDCLRVRV